MFKLTTLNLSINRLIMEPYNNRHNYIHQISSNCWSVINSNGATSGTQFC